jgi:hypothetical protein
MRQHIILRKAVQFTFYCSSGEGSVVYSLIISRLKYIRSVDPIELPESSVDSSFIIALWLQHVPSVVVKGSETNALASHLIYL